MSGAELGELIAPTPRSAKRQQRRASIVDAAARAFSAGGFETTSMDDIAEAAGVTKLILYRHFESKEELYLTTVTKVADRLRNAVMDEVQKGHRRGSIVMAFLSVAREDPDGFRLLWRQSAREPRFARYAEEVRTASVGFSHRILEKRISDPVILEWAAPQMVAFLVESVLIWLDVGAEADDDKFVETARASTAALLEAWSR